MKSAPPIALTLSPWTGRKDARTLTADREDSEAAIRTAHATMAVQCQAERIHGDTA